MCTRRTAPGRRAFASSASCHPSRRLSCMSPLIRHGIRVFNSTNLWTWKTTASLSVSSPQGTLRGPLPPPGMPPLLPKLRGKLRGTLASRRAATSASLATPPPPPPPTFRPLAKTFSAPALTRPRLLESETFVAPSSRTARGGTPLPAAAPAAPLAIAPAESAKRAAAACGGEKGTGPAGGAATAAAAAPDPVKEPDASRRRDNLLPIGDSAGVMVAVGSACSAARRSTSAGDAFSLTPLRPART